MGVEGAGSAQSPYESFPSVLGTGGLQLNKPLDRLAPNEAARLSNFDPTTGELRSRPGQTVLADTTTGAAVHSLARLEDPHAAAFTRLVGAGTALLRGVSGALPVLEGGFSGDPLTICPARPPQSGEPWAIIADRTKTRKTTRTGPILPVGLPAPSAVPAVAVQPKLKTPICAFANSDYTGLTASAWVVYNHTVPIARGSLAAIPGPSGTGGGLLFVTDPSTVPAGTPYVHVFACPFRNSLTTGDYTTRDLTVLPGGVAASDEDLIHLWMKFNVPSKVLEVKVYFQCSPFANPDVLSPPDAPTGTFIPIPGTDSVYNLAAYMRAFRPSDYSQLLAQAVTASTAAATIRQQQLLQGYTDPVVTDPHLAIPSSSGLTGMAWTEYGAVGFPLRRSDFLRIGTAGESGTDWSTISAIWVVVTVADTVAVDVALDDCYLTGGYGPDTTEPGTERLNHRYTWFDTRTGAESNGSPIQDESVWGDAQRQAIQITPPAYGDPAIRQNIYRRGGTLTDNWFFVGQTASDGAPFLDTLSDTAIDTSGANTIPVDHFQPVATTATDGTAVLAVPPPVIFGPFDDGVYCALGDPYRPGHLYACRAGEIDHWPSTGGYAVEVCPPSEELMNGGVWGGQAFVLSRERGYAVHANLAGGEGIVVTPTSVTPGLAARWGFCLGPGGLYYVAKDGVRVTAGQASEVLSDAIRPLFLWDPAGTAPPVPVNGYYPIDWTHPEAIHLAVHQLQLWLLYQDTQGARGCLVYSLLQAVWWSYTFGRHPSAVAAEVTAQGPALLLGATDGVVYRWDGFQDGPGVVGGSPDPVIHCAVRTGAWDLGRPREEKQLAEVFVQADVPGMNLRLITLLNEEAVANAEQVVTGLPAPGLHAYLFEPFGATPQHARTVSLNLQVDAPAAALQTGADGAVRLRRAEVSYVFEPQVTLNRATTWETLTTEGGPEGYLIGVLLDCDTGGTDRTILVESDLAGVISTVATLTVNANGRHKLWFSWQAHHAQAVRLRPTGECEPWMLWRCTWLAMPEPPRIARWDTNFETQGDSYYTGFDVECDTFGAAKTVQAYVDQVLVGTFTVQATGRRYLHFTINPPGRGHIYRLVAIDDAPGLLYTHKWYLDPEPSEQWNWNQNFTTYSSLSDKYLKALVIEMDSFGQDKTIAVQADGVTQRTLTINHDGRKVGHYSFPQVLGRVFRILPTDSFPSRLYQLSPVFDEEPYQFSRWEGQLSDWDLGGSGWGSFLSADVCLRSTATVTFELDVYNSDGVLIKTLTHTIPATGGVKQKVFVPAAAATKGVLTKPLFTSAAPFTLYKEESRVRIIPWGESVAVSRPWWGDSDTDRTREMVSSVVAAGKSGGGTG